MIATASFKADSPKINMYSLLSTFEGMRDKTVTGSVEEIMEPKTKDSTKERGNINFEKKNIMSDVTKVEYRAPAKANANIVKILLKKETRFIV